jgi:hemolysin III
MRPSSEARFEKPWWYNPRGYSAAELWADGAIHTLGLAIAVLGGTWVLFLAWHDVPTVLGPLAIYVGSLTMVLAISFVFNMSPVVPIKRLLARLDQAAIFLLIAGTYTPLLALLGGAPTASLMMTLVWAASIGGVALKMIVPQYFARTALLLYLGIGLSGVLVFDRLAAVLPHSTLWLLLAGGIAYMTGIIFHVWEKLRYHNAIWHAFVVTGASLHLWAIVAALS